MKMNGTMLETPPEVFTSTAVINGRYELGARLGQGGMGVVYRALDRQHPERALAVKTDLAEHVSDSALSLFKAEFKAMAELRHPNVAKVYDFEPIQGGDSHLFTMEYVDGRNILDATRDASHGVVLDFIVQTCRALSFVHSRKLIHLDLKPANVLVDRDGAVKVLDFGLVGARATDTSSPYVGTPSYVAPEMLGNGRQIDHRVDLYSLGVTWYELLCRHVPFRAKRVVDVLDMHRNAPITFDDEVRERCPAWTLSIIERLCAKHPADRFRSGNAVIEAINAGGGHSYDFETSATRDSYFFSGKFVGRERELEALLGFVGERLSDGPAPREPVFMVAGPSGGGKSRLMLEVRHRAQLSKLAFIEADCYDGSFTEYEPIVTAASYAVRLAESLGETDLLNRFAPALASLDERLAGRPVVPETAISDNPDAARLAMIGQIGEFFVAVAERAPFVLYINDLQWARSGTLDVLTNLSRLIAVRERGGARARIALLGSYRDDEIDGRPLENALRGLRDHHELRVALVAPLSRDEVSALLGSMLGLDELPEGFVDRVRRETAGNPFFVIEVVRSLVERGSVYMERGRWAADRPIGYLEIPATMTALFERRVACLEGRERDVLEIIATFGRPIPLSLIAHVAKLADDGLHRIILALLRRQMVSRGLVGGDLCAWTSHDRIREMVYSRIDPSTRLGLHRALARALEEQAGDDDTAGLDALARQWWGAEDRDKALHYCLRGAAQAKRRHALETGIELLEHALELLPEDRRADRTSVEDDLATMLAFTGDFERATELYDRVLPELGSVIDRARVLKQLASIAYHRGQTARALDTGWKALALLGDSRPRTRFTTIARIARLAIEHSLARIAPRLLRRKLDPALAAAKADCYLSLVTPLIFVDHREMAVAVLSAMNLAEQLGPSPQLAYACSFHGMFIGVAFNRFEAGMASARRGLAIAESLDLPWHRAHALQTVALLHFMQGQWEAGRKAASAAKALFHAHSDIYCVGSSHCVLLLNYLGQGLIGAARQTAQEGLEIVERVGALSISNPVSMKCGAMLVDMGHDDTGLTRLLETFRSTEEIGDPLQRVWVRLFLGHAYFARAELAVAIQYLEECIEIRRRAGLGADFLSGRALPLLARVYLEAARTSGDDAQRKRWLRAAGRHAKAGLRSMRVRTNYRSAALLAMAEFRWDSGRRAEGRRLFDDSIALADRQGSRIMFADAHYELGRRLVDEDGPVGRHHLQAALEVYDACDAVAYVRMVERELARAGVGRRAADQRSSTSAMRPIRASTKARLVGRRSI
ncbi:MAG TPA: protein kinase [Gemmatimonadaceae bacterium]|nr:protein kinase [Gemmatimonadaceae bacterium]